ncbi:MAG TPA: hypothetical protein VK171_07300 [Fimbriimonas sp.]|nr:hypothetical protein [Fimbriimonas sp.]
MNLDRVTVATSNNADLYEAVMDAHCVESVREQGVFRVLGTPPPYFSVLTTLEPGWGVYVMNLRPAGFKDAFHEIEAADHGYNLLFTSSWIWLESPQVTEPQLTWKEATNYTEQAEWQDRWWGVHATERTTIYPASMVENSDFRFLTAFDHDQPLGCAMLNRSDSVIGISNLFAFQGSDLSLWRDIAGVAARRFPGMPLCGYERDDSLGNARSSGFEAIGQLRVWTL